MPPATKKPCLNSPNHTYTGKESTPYGLGYVAEVEPTGKIMEGRDKRMWMVGIRNGVKVWCPVPTELAKDKPVIEREKAEEPKAKEKLKEKEKEKEKPPATPAPTKKAEPKIPKAPRKKKEDKPIVKEEIEEDDEIKEDVPEPLKEEKEEKPKKKEAKPKAKKEVKEKAEKPKAAKNLEPELEKAKPEKKAAAVKRAPTKFNLYVQYRLKNMDDAIKALPHQARFGEFAKEWKAMSDEEKAAKMADIM
jgi:hypothetical protein